MQRITKQTGDKIKPDSNAKSREQPTWWLKGGYPLLWIAIGAFLLYGQSIGFSYSYLDDHNLILNQLDKIQHLNYIPQAFREDVFHMPAGKGFYYRPILTVSFVLDAVIGSGSLWIFHFSNIIYHLLAVYLLFLCLTALKFDPLKSFLFSLVFLFHPVVTQAVAWIPGRNDILLTVFILTSFLFFIRYLDNAKWQNFLFHSVFWFLALLTKETALILPVLLFPAGLLLFRAPLRKLIFPGLVWIFLVILWFSIRASVLGNESNYQVKDSVVSLMANLPAILPFLGKSLLPFSLSVFPILTDMKASSVLGIVSVIILVIMVFFTRPRTWGFFLFTMAWYILFLVPTFIKHTQTEDLTEHRLYLPLIGIILVFMISGPVRKINPGKSISKTLVGMVIILFAIISVIHLQAFRDRYTFWQNAVNTSPSHAYNYNTLGAMYFLDGELVQAERYFRKAVEINPSEPQVNANIGLICMRKGDIGEAEKFYRKEIRINPQYDNVYYNYGILYFKKGNIDSAIVSWEKTIEISPAYINAYRALMMVYDTLHLKADYFRIKDLAEKNGLIKTIP